MAMPSGNMVMPEKMQFPNSAGGGGGGGEMLYRQQQWYVDERDGFIGWLRSEFAAANAIIDSMCHHLRAVGELGEYDAIVGAIQQRRCNWNQVLLMQQYFSVSEVVYALQQVTWRKQQQHQHNRHHVVADPVKAGGGGGGGGGSGMREFRNFRQGGQRFEVAANKEGYNSNANAAEKGAHGTEKNDEVVKSGGKVGTMGDSNGLGSAEEDKKDAATKHQSNGILNSSGNSQGSLSNSASEAAGVNGGCISNTTGNDSHSTQDQHQIQNPSTLGKTFIGNEMFDGKTVNVVDGLKLYEELFDSNEVSKLVSLVDDLRATGKRGQFQGTQTYVVSKRPMRGHGREMIQLGVPIFDAPPDVGHVKGSSKEKNVESMPSLFQDIIERMAASQVITVKPDACIVDFYNEGDHSHPYNWPPWYGRPICMLSLTECDMTFGRVIVSDHPGDFRGTLKLSLVPGSFLVMQGKSTDFAKYAIPSIRKQRILVTFTKSQPKKSLQMDAQRLSLPASSHWAPPPSRSPNHIRHQVGHKHYATVPTSGVLPAPSMRPQIPPPNGMQPLYVPAPVGPPMSFTAPVPISPGSTGWTAAPSRHPPTRLPVPGTGVFLPPPGSGNSSQQLPGTLTDVNPSVETSSLPDQENAKTNHNNTCASPKVEIDGKTGRQEGNGNLNGTEVEKAIEKEQENTDNAVASH